MAVTVIPTDYRIEFPKEHYTLFNPLSPRHIKVTLISVLYIGQWDIMG